MHCSVLRPLVDRPPLPPRAHPDQLARRPRLRQSHQLQLRHQARKDTHPSHRGGKLRVHLDYVTQPCDIGHMTC